MSADDQRASGSISITISGQLIAAALAMLTIEGGLIAFVYGSRETTGWFLFFLITGAIAFIFSILNGGAGMDALRKAGYEGDWSNTTCKSNFNSQAIFCILGLVMFFSCAFCIGPSKQDSTQTQIDSIRQRMIQVEESVKQQAGQAQIAPVKCIEKKVIPRKTRC